VRSYFLHTNKTGGNKHEKLNKNMEQLEDMSSWEQVSAENTAIIVDEIKEIRKEIEKIKEDMKQWKKN